MTNNYVKFPIHHFPPSVSWGSLCMHVLVYILCGGGDIKALSTHRVYQLALLPSFYCMMSWAQHAPALRTIAVYTFPSSFFFFFCKCIWGDVTQEVGKCPQVERLRHENEQNPNPGPDLLPPQHGWWMFVTTPPLMTRTTQRTSFCHTVTWSYFPGQKSVNVSLLKSKNTLFWREACVARVSWKYLL